MVARNDPSRVFAGLVWPPASGWIDRQTGASQALYQTLRRESSRQETSR